ncbi:MAG: hypothetical protein ACPGVT_07685 [Maricaulaceae bacterium]
MGDDLIAARRFCADADQHLAVLQSESLTDHTALACLKKLKLAANTVNARAISRTAQHLINVLGIPGGASEGDVNLALAPHIKRLSKVLELYQHGLADIEALTAEVSNTDDHSKAAKNAHKNENEIATSTARNNSAYENARATLKPLLQFTSAPSEYAALTKLAGLGMRQDTKKLYAYSHLKAPDQNTLKLTFDALIPAITDAALKTARRSQKVVSLSYDCDSKTFSSRCFKSIESNIAATLETLIANIIESPDIRQARGQSRSAHIALSIKQIGPGIHISFECPGTAIPLTFFAAMSRSDQNYKTAFRSDKDKQYLIMTMERQSAMPPVKRTHSEPLTPNDITPTQLYEGALR